MTERTSRSSPGLPTPEQVIELLADEFARSGYEIDDVAVDARARPPRIVVVADGDTPLDLDTVSELSRSASAVLDAADAGWEPYVLEVGSRGVDRPLTAEKHFRRARGRRIEVSLADGQTLTGRVGETAGGEVDLVVRSGGDWKVRRLPLNEIRKAVVQVEFSAPPARELELAGVAHPTPTEAGE